MYHFAAGSVGSKTLPGENWVTLFSSYIFSSNPLNSLFSVTLLLVALLGWRVL